MPIVPQVNIDCPCGFGYQHQEVDAQANRDYQCADGGIVSHRSRSRPSHVKHIQLQVINIRNRLQRVVEVSCQQSGNNPEPDEAHTYKESRLESLTEFHANAQANDREDDWHHHAGAQAYDIAKYLFHFLIDN